ncbi:hypothetical protein LPC08_16515 [Roseomonas sp. OT10]|uniref:bestrophin-like domain n=1 Tax=Roseomonas cutis TaxID=2897332 RepID=UPI001E3338BA|nr:hypothetical protein [Roseomonas sp. OT10]UFN47609.1 hypothetical protein LPC08_16515 [Roseomonas sp. OT10]
MPTSSLLIPVLLPLLLVVASSLGWLVQQRMPPHHRRQETMDAIRLVMSILITFAALVLGLLISSAKAVYDGQDRALRAYSLDLIDLDQRLREYGPEAAPERRRLHGFVTGALTQIWPENNRPAPDGGPAGARSPEDQDLGSQLLALDEEIARFQPATPGQQRTLSLLQARMTAVLQQRLVLVEAGSATVTWPFLTVLAFWLVIVFAIIGLSTPSNALVHVVIGLGTLSVSVALFLILELETPLSGAMKIPDTPLQETLRQIGRPS